MAEFFGQALVKIRSYLAELLDQALSSQRMKHKDRPELK